MVQRHGIKRASLVILWTMSFLPILNLKSLAHPWHLSLYFCFHDSHVAGCRSGLRFHLSLSPKTPILPAYLCGPSYGDIHHLRGASGKPRTSHVPKESLVTYHTLHTNVDKCSYILTPSIPHPPLSVASSGPSPSVQHPSSGCSSRPSVRPLPPQPLRLHSALPHPSRPGLRRRVDECFAASRRGIPGDCQVLLLPPVQRS